MTVETQTRKAQYQGNGAATSFPVAFAYSRAADLRLVLTGADGTDTPITQNYDITVGAGGETRVVYPLAGPPLAAGERLTIYRDTPQTQVVDLIHGGSFNPDVLETDGFDRAVMMVQELREEIDRAVKISITSVDEPVTAEELYANVNQIADRAEDAVTRAEDAVIRSESAREGAEDARDEAATSAAEAADASELARRWAENPVDEPVTGGGESGYSAFHWARKALENASGLTLSDRVDSEASDVAASSRAVKTAHDAAVTARDAADAAQGVAEEARDAAVPKTRIISAAAPLTGGGSLEGDLALGVDMARADAAGVTWPGVTANAMFMAADVASYETVFFKFANNGDNTGVLTVKTAGVFLLLCQGAGGGGGGGYDRSRLVAGGGGASGNCTWGIYELAASSAQALTFGVGGAGGVGVAATSSVPQTDVPGKGGTITSCGALLSAYGGPGGGGRCSYAAAHNRMDAGGGPAAYQRYCFHPSEMGHVRSFHFFITDKVFNWLHGGTGGSSAFGRGGIGASRGHAAATYPPQDGGDGTGYGSGGGGGAGATGVFNGGNGAPGCIYIMRMA